MKEQFLNLNYYMTVVIESFNNIVKDMLKVAVCGGSHCLGHRSKHLKHGGGGELSSAYYYSTFPVALIPII